jgi:SOS-response transcriptional repressor LexA
MDTFGQRLRSVREAAGLSQASAAKAVGMQQPTLSGLENDGSVRSTFTTALAELYGVSATWLATGKGPRKMPQVIQGAGGIADPEPSPGPAVRGRVPLISSVRAGAFVEARDPFQPGDAQDWIDTTVPIQEHTFALRVEGESMLPDFPEGTILIVEPSLDAFPNDFVIVKNGDNEATFKQLVKDGGEYYLKPLNTRFPIKPLGSNRIIGVVRETVRRFR